MMGYLVTKESSLCVKRGDDYIKRQNQEQTLFDNER